MKRRTLSIFCDTLVKSLKSGNVLKGCHRVVAPDIVEGGKRSFHTQVSPCSTTTILSQEEQHISRTCHLPQLDVPDNPDDLFRGMSTDFPCLTRNKMAGPEPEYDKIITGYKLFHHQHPFEMKYNKARLPELQVAYETWGKLNETKSNAVMIQAGLSASSHAKSHRENLRPGWWEKFVGPGCAVDTDEFFVICPNNLGSCYGTT